MVALSDLPEDTHVDALAVEMLWERWADGLPDPEAAPTLEEVCDRAGLPEAVARSLDWKTYKALPDAI